MNHLVQQHPDSSGFPVNLFTDPAGSGEILGPIVMQMTEGVLVVDARGALVACNPSAERILRAPREQMLGRTAADPHWRTIRQDGTPLRFEDCPLAVCLRTGQPQTEVIMGIHDEDAKLVWIVVDAYPISQTSTTALGGAVVFFRDITAFVKMGETLAARQQDLERQVQERTRDLEAEIAQRTAMQAALQRSQMILAEAERIGHLGSWELDLAAGKIRLSEEAAWVHGLAGQTGPLAFATVFRRIHREDRDAVIAAVKRAMGESEGQECQYRVTLPNGGIRMLYARGEAERSGNGKPVRVFGMVQDVTDRVRTETELVQRVRDLMALEVLSRSMSLRLPWAELVQVILQRVATFTGADMVQLLLLKGDRLARAGLHSRPGVADLSPDTETGGLVLGPERVRGQVVGGTVAEAAKTVADLLRARRLA